MRKFYFTIILTLFILNHVNAEINKGYIIEIVKHIKHRNGISSIEYYNYYIDSSLDSSTLKQILYSNIDIIEGNILLIKIINSYTFNKNDFFKGKYADFKRIQNERVYKTINSKRKSNISIKIVKGEFEFDIREESLELFSKEFINISHFHMNVPVKNKNEPRTVAYLKSFQNLEILNDKEISWFGLK